MIKGAPEQFGLVVLFLGAWAVALQTFRRYRRRTQAGQEWAQFKARLDKKTKSFESTVGLALLLISFATVFDAVLRVRHAFHPNEESGGASMLAIILIVYSSFVVAMVPAFMLSNLASWLVPSVRLANRIAGEGLPTASIGRATLGLMKFGAVVIPICLAQIYLGVVMQ